MGKKTKIISSLLGVMLIVLICFSMRSFAEKDSTINYEKYFAHEQADMQLNEGSIDFIMQSEEAEIAFSKPLSADGFNVKFWGIEGSQIQRIDFVLTDMNDESCSIEASFSKMNDENSALTINRMKRSYIVAGSLYRGSDNPFNLSYDMVTNTISDETGNKVPVLTNLQGDSFAGFPSQQVRLIVRLHGAKGTIFRISEINRQRLGADYTEDDTAPTIILSHTISKVLRGSVVALPTAVASDVFAEETDVKMNVVNPSGEIVKAVDGTKLENVSPDVAYQIAIEEDGQYRVEYQATDGINTTRKIAYQIYVADETKPELDLSGALPTKAKVGDKLEIPSMEYSDNISKEDNLHTWITVKLPGGQIKGIDPTEKSYEVKTEGIYTFSFFVVDEAGNIEKTEQIVYVTGGK